MFLSVKDNKLCCKGHILDLNVYYTCNKYKYVEKCLCLGTLKISYLHWENGFIRYIIDVARSLVDIKFKEYNHKHKKY